MKAGNLSDERVLKIIGIYVVILLCVTIYIIVEMVNNGSRLGHSEEIAFIAIFMSFISAIMAYSNAKIKISTLIMARVERVSSTNKTYKIHFFNERDRSEYIHQAYIRLDGDHKQVMHQIVKISDKKAQSIILQPFGSHSFEFNLNSNINIENVTVILSITSGKHICLKAMDFWQPNQSEIVHLSRK
ncbi:hypothetical protein AB4497_11935 [Vibrio cyclitrophicus]